VWAVAVAACWIDSAGVNRYPPSMGTLYYDECWRTATVLATLRRYIEDEPVDLVYLDPPPAPKAFGVQSDLTHNVLFQEKNPDTVGAASQIQAFEDTWHWNMDSERAYAELATKLG
jgi:hypothetical protein